MFGAVYGFGGIGMGYGLGSTSGLFNNMGSSIGNTFQNAGTAARQTLGNPAIMGIGGGLLGFTIGGPVGALMGAGLGALLGQSLGQSNNQQPAMNPQMAGMMMPGMGMMGNAGMMGMMPGMGMGMMPGMGMNGMYQQQMMMQMQMMMMQMQMMMMMMQMGQSGQMGGMNPGMFPQTMGPRNYMGTMPGMSGNYNNGYLPGLTTGPQPYNPVSGNRLANLAGSMGGQHFKPGQTHRCADFVSTMIQQSGAAPPGFQHQVSCTQLQKYGTPVDMANLKPGDVVFFGNTYKQGQYTHTGIYLGNGQFAHRPTANKPVKIDNLNSSYWSSHFSGGRRLA